MEKRQILELLLMTLIFYLTAWMFCLGPDWQAVKKIETEIRSIQDQLTLFTEKNTELKNINVQSTEIQKQFETIKTTMTSSSLSQLLAFCEQTSQQAGLKLVAFQPGKESVHTFYSQKELTLKLTGSFQSHISFLQLFKRGNNFLSLQEIKLKDTGTKAGLSMQVVFQAYNTLGPEAE